MSRRLNLKDKMEEINERFSHKNKAALANDLLENKLKYLYLYSVTSIKRCKAIHRNINRKCKL